MRAERASPQAVEGLAGVRVYVGEGPALGVRELIAHVAQRLLKSVDVVSQLIDVVLERCATGVFR